ncbi:4928_t:CDS:2 [Paraglomus brasilianum]|uniref:4928_t:CDS:1 n=1 Tax=Paraglomus brasilianum TaxID=144538 RepID=A0A9N9CSP3_9GLOM|nr:4928_t:CDS:2 [Paraglomus brasilianum]
MKFSVKGLTQSIIDKKDDYKDNTTIATLPAFEPHPPPPQSDYTFSYSMSSFAYEGPKKDPFSWTAATRKHSKEKGSHSRSRTDYDDDCYDDSNKLSADVNGSYSRPRTAYDFYDSVKKISTDGDSPRPRTTYDYFEDMSKKLSADIDNSHLRSGTSYGFHDESKKISAEGYRNTGMVVVKDVYVAPEKPSTRLPESAYNPTKTSSKTKSYGPYPSLDSSDFSYSPYPDPQTSYNNPSISSTGTSAMPFPVPNPIIDHDYNIEPPPPYSEIAFSHSGGNGIRQERYPDDTRQERYPEDKKDRYGDDTKGRIGGDTKKERRRRPRPITELRECEICCSEKELTEFKPITEKCAHAASVCLRCIELHIRHEVYDKGKTEIKCPGLDGTKTCQGIMDHHNLKEFATDDVFKRLDQLKTTYALAAIPDFYWCKNPDCQSGQIHSDGEAIEPQPAQPTLTRKQLAKIKKQEEDRLRKLAKAEQATKTFLSNKTKSCPKCGTRIQKNGGCDHMTCTVPSCKHEFCWKCFADYKKILQDGNEFHETSCKYYAPPPPPS